MRQAQLVRLFLDFLETQYKIAKAVFFSHLILTQYCMEGLKIYQASFGGKATLIRGEEGKKNSPFWVIFQGFTDSEVYVWSVLSKILVFNYKYIIHTVAFPEAFFSF